MEGAGTACVLLPDGFWDSEAVSLFAALSQPVEMRKYLIITERSMEPLLLMEVSKNLLSSVPAVEAAHMACVLMLADFSNLEALFSAVKLSQSVDLSSTGGDPGDVAAGGGCQEHLVFGDSRHGLYPAAW